MFEEDGTARASSSARKAFEYSKNAMKISII